MKIELKTLFDRFKCIFKIKMSDVILIAGSVFLVVIIKGLALETWEKYLGLISGGMVWGYFYAFMLYDREE